MKTESKTVRETNALASLLSREVKDFHWKGSNALVIQLIGDLGAGKTTFSKAFGKGLGVRTSMQSPTFVLMKRYPIKTTSFDNLWHIDCYRVDSIRELNVVGFQDILSNPKNILLIEWADRITESLPRDSITATFSHKSPRKRVISFSS